MGRRNGNTLCAFLERRYQGTLEVILTEFSVIQDARKDHLERMPIEILTSIQNDFGYYDNLGYLRKELAAGRIQFQGFVNNHAPDAFVYDNKHRTYDFTRSALPQIRENKTAYLSRPNVLPGLQSEDSRKIREAFDSLFNYYGYKGYLDHVNRERQESMYMLIFNVAQQYVAHVFFTSTSRRTGIQQFTVNASLTCQQFDFFPVQQTDFQVVLRALENLHV